MNIKDRLRELDRLQHKIAPTQPQPSFPASQLNAPDLFTDIFKPRAGDFPHLASAKTNAGENLQQLAAEGCFLLEHCTALDATIGEFTLHELPNLSPELVAIAGKDERLATLDLRRTLFIDTETTGLAGGAGTVAFLVGVGYLSDEAFVVRQYFMRDFHEEAALLHLLAQQVDAASGLVSFNGRAFDVPLLNSRYIINRRRAAFDGMPHFDLLHAARRVWRETVASCTLGELERSILGIQRHDDVPGALVPQIYFDYLHSGKLDGLREVFLHNRQDILSMAALVIRLCQMIKEPLSSTTLRERHRLGTLFRKVRQLERSAQVFENLVERERSAQNLETFAELALCYKRLQRHDEACRLWMQAIEKLAFHPVPYIELAKHYEHRLKDFDQAIALTERALRAIQLREELKSDGESEIYRLDLEKRWQRLKRKRAVSSNQ